MRYNVLQHKHSAYVQNHLQQTVEEWLLGMSWSLFFFCEEIELSGWTRKGSWMHQLWCGEQRTHVLWSYKQTLKDNSHFSHFLNANICPAAEFYKSLHNISRITKERANQAEWLQMENKRRHRIFQAPSGCLSEGLLKCLLKRWFVCGSATMRPCQRVICWSCHMWNGPMKGGSAYTCGAPKPHPKQIKKTHVNTCSKPQMVLVFFLYHPKGNW